jgi:hypothetical protein
MSSRVEICNRALLEIKRGTIGSLTQTGSPEAQACALYYPMALRDVLAAHPWSFATVTEALAEHSVDPPAEWAYRYAMPSGDLITAQRLTTDGTAPGLVSEDYRIEVLPDRSAQSVLAQVAPAYLTYTYFCDDPNFYPPLFETALVYRLASELAMAMGNDREGQMMLRQMFATAMGEARVGNMSQGQSARPEAGSVAARG